MDNITARSHSLSTPLKSIPEGGTKPTTLATHNAEVSKIAHAVRSFHDRGQKFRIYHGSTNSTRKSALGRDRNTVVDTSMLDHVVNVDTEKRTALVEPNVPMDRLVEETLKYGLMPPVVMEFPGITVGGGYNGTSGESSSFRHGFFDRTLLSIEMVLADGEIATASEDERQDLFRGGAGALGTLGVTTMVEIQLEKATKFVETTYHPVYSIEEAISTIQKIAASDDKIDYLDGLLFSPTSGAIITGRKTNTITPGSRIQRFSSASDPWFYLHAHQRITSHRPETPPPTDTVPLPDYLFRYDRGGFWVGAETFNYFPGTPFTSLTRWFLDDFLHTRMLYSALHASGRSEQMIIQDLALPYEHAKEFIARMDSLTGIWPLWLCPLKQSPGPTMHPHLNERDCTGQLMPMLNVGLWGAAPTSHVEYVQVNRKIEQTLKELRGMKWLYAQTFQSEEDFWTDFDKEWYDDLRRRYRATALPSVYEKVKGDTEAKEAIKGSVVQKVLDGSLWDLWPLPGLRGLKASIDSGSYLQAREASWRNWVSR